MEGNVQSQRELVRAALKKDEPKNNLTRREESSEGDGSLPAVDQRSALSFVTWFSKKRGAIPAEQR
jgi:hypothetical protein